MVAVHRQATMMKCRCDHRTTDTAGAPTESPRRSLAYIGAGADAHARSCS